MTQSSMSFVRDKMLTQQKPPVSEVGAVRWVRENLFSSPLNGFLTLISLYVVYWIIASSLPWFLNGVWTANSLGECRQIIEANAGPGAEGACWAILRERWHQFLFGFYPMDAYWRPVLAFGLMLMALAPALYYGLRRVNMLMLGTVSVLTLLGMLGVGEGLDETFADVGELAKKCRFTDCGHSSEPGCAVRAAIERHDLGEERLQDYFKLRKESAFHDSSYVERRKKDRDFGRFVHSAMKHKANRGGE